MFVITKCTITIKHKNNKKFLIKYITHWSNIFFIHHQRYLYSGSLIPVWVPYCKRLNIKECTWLKFGKISLNDDYYSNKKDAE